MKRLVLHFFLSGLLILPQFTLAAEPLAAKETATLAMSTVLNNLKINGYDMISKVELDKEVFNIQAITPQGKELSITMNAHSGEITNPKHNPIPQVSLVEAVKRVEGSGYHELSMIKYSGGKYIVKAFDEKDKKVKLKVDGETGDIKQAWF